ncbi:MAG: hypothetical protein K9N05_01705 [Candidatus Marinimicrobia bacterium]|nr:hypothetical protein [Candidatus Neomarinimicrobiota bacterium]
MKQIRYIIAILLFLCAILNAQQIIRWIVIVEVPLETPKDAEVYIAGNFNLWNPADQLYKLIPVRTGLYTLTMNMNIDDVEFKFTLGSWDKVEVLSNNEDRPNRIEKFKNVIIKETYKVEAWANREHRSTMTGNIKIIEDFTMPQLERTRCLRVYLPPGYGNSLKRYPVMYMHDGQNLFSDATAYSGEWGIDETLEKMIKKKEIPKMIVVGIDNHSRYRLNEYTPFPFEYHGQEIDAEAQLYGRFLVETLKPYIDKHYRTKKGRKFTAVSGSSMGGLVSVYLALEYQEIFSKVGALSSAFGVCRDDLIGFIAQHPKEYPIRFWLDAGTEEGENMKIETNQIQIRNALIAAGWEDSSEVIFKIYEGAEHHESYWRQRFGDVLEFLWDKKHF